MRIVQIIPTFSLGGTEKAGCVIAAALGAMGHEAHVVARESGPRRQDVPPAGVTHHITPIEDDRLFAQAVMELKPDVVHWHGPRYDAGVIEALGEAIESSAGRTALVVTPVFGRPPADNSLLERWRVKTCCVGLYTFHRMARWRSMTPEQAVASGIIYAPMTPFDPPPTPVSAVDPPDAVRARRREFGVESARMVIGRVGRNAPGKWDKQTPEIVDRLLSSIDDLAWLSIGMPAEVGAERLARDWAGRFVNLPESADYDRLCRVIASLDAQLFISRYGECFASSICEPAGLGVPTIAFSSPLRDNGQAEQVIDGVTGYLVRGVDEIERCVRMLRHSPERLAALKQTTRDHVNANWTAEIVARRLAQAYEHWLSGGGGPFPLGEEIIEKCRGFSADYAQRVCSLGDPGPLSYAARRASLAAAENYTLFRFARNFKRYLPR